MEALSKIIRDRIELAGRTLDTPLTFEFTDSDRQQQQQRERDRKHIAARRRVLAAEAIEEPKAIVASYEVLRRRVEPVALVHPRLTKQ